jgi:ParB/RepB/Spo0J family partition protein
MEYGDITELAENIKKLGLLSPILVRPIDERYEIVHGHRRFMAFKHHKQKHIPGVVRELTDKQALIIHGSENIQREEFSPIETARYYEQCRKFFSVKEIARETKKTEAHVKYHLYLINLPEEIQAKIHRGDISYVKARALAKLAIEKPVTAVTGADGRFKQAPSTTQYFDQIRVLARDEGLRDALSIAKAANLIRDGVQVDEAVDAAKKDYATRRLKRWGDARPPIEIWRNLIENLPDPSGLDKMILKQYPKLVQKLLDQGLLSCPHCGDGHLIWKCCGRQIDEASER